MLAIPAGERQARESGAVSQMGECFSVVVFIETTFKAPPLTSKRHYGASCCLLLLGTTLAIVQCR